MKSLINIIKENGSGKEEAVEEVSSNIEEACCEDELYELPLETLTDILSHTGQVEYKTAHTILTKATAKYGKRSVNVLSSLHVDEGLSELELETLLSLIPGIQIFTLLGSFTKKVEVDYEETIENERKLRKNLETEVEMKNKGFDFLANEVNELKLQMELTKLKEMEDSRTNIEQKLKKFNSFDLKSKENNNFRDELQQEINVKPKEFEESIAKAKNCVNELQRIVNESNKMIKTYEKSQKAFSKLVTKLQKKFNEINNYQKLENRVILVGAASSGKSILVDVFAGKEFSYNSHLGTIMVKMSQITNPHNHDVLKFYEIPELYVRTNFIRAYFIHYSIFLLCFSKNSRRDFDYLIEHFVETDLLNNNKVILVKTKIDSADDEEEDVPREEVVRLTTEKGYKYFEVSAKTGEGIDKLREYIFEITSEV